MKTRGACYVLAGMITVACASSNLPKGDLVPTDSVATKQATQQNDAAILAWRAAREADLRDPEGWLAQIGLHWLDEGEQTVGSAATNDIVMAIGPEHLGVVRLDQGSVRFVADASARDLRVQTWQTDRWVDAVPDLPAGYSLAPDFDAAPSRIPINPDVNVTLIRRGDRWALRVKDTNAPALAGFSGLEYFDIDPSWRIQAQWIAHPRPRMMQVPRITGAVEAMPNLGVAVFQRNGREYRLFPVQQEGSKDLFIIFADRSNGRQSYGAGRFLDATLADDGGSVLIDFNLAYNPPCAFNEFSTCPLPPDENRLDVAVTAGEKKYRAAHE